MRIILLNDRGDAEGVYDNEEAAKFLPQGMTVAVDDETARKIAQAFSDYTVHYADGQFTFTENGNAEKRKICDEIGELERWFAEYDRQIAQFQRAQRLGLEYDNRYGTVDELDAKAQQNAEKLTQLRAMI